MAQANRTFAEKMRAHRAKILDPQNKYFSRKGSVPVPYHSVETVVVEAPSHGHETTSEAASLWVYMEAMNGIVTGDFSGLTQAWNATEAFFIPGGQDTYADYNPTSPARYAPEWEEVSKYPTSLSWEVTTGQDPLAAQLKAKHGSSVYSMHWQGDPDNMYGFGSLFNTFQRGAMESVWDTVPQPCVDDKSSGGPNGFLDLFVKQDGAPPAQWKYTVASDADARAIQAVLFAKWFCEKNGRPGPPADIVQKAIKMGDWLTYVCYDKYFQKIGCQSQKAPGAGDEAFHGLLSWYTAFGGPLQKQGWAFRIGCSHSHSGYQNPMCSHFLGLDSLFADKWKRSTDRQLELFGWLQSKDGPIAGGCTNSWNGRYEDYPAGTKTFYNMGFQMHPVYLNPPSNNWYGIQCWGMERVVQLYYVTRDARLKNVVTDWVAWAAAHVHQKKKYRAVLVPSTLEWSGAPDADWNGPTASNPFPRKSQGLRCKVTSYGSDLGVMAAMARCMIWYLGAIGQTKAGTGGAVRAALDKLLGAFDRYGDSLGCASSESRADYVSGFDRKVYVPPGWTGKMPGGEPIDQNSTFYSLREHLFKDDPMYAKVRASIDAGKAPKFKIHRFWAQTEIATTLAAAALILQ